MPKKRAKPNKTWLISNLPKITAQQLSTAQRAHLKAIYGLPEAALPALEAIAKAVLYPHPSNAEVRARLGLLSKRIAALQKEITETDAFTVALISSIPMKLLVPWATQFPNPLRGVDSVLSALAQRIDVISKLSGIAPMYPGWTSSTVAREVHSAFRKFDVPFSSRKESPAIETVDVILNMARPTGLDAARQAVRRVVSNGDRKKAPV
jgi:hypothetical protein